MPQWFRLDRRVRLAYLALGLSGCHTAAPALMPTGLSLKSPADIQGWVKQTEPTGRARHRFRWLYEDEESSKGGRGSAHIAGPDTLRFDFAGSLGLGKGSALIVGDSSRWVVPERSVEELVPSLPLLWALFGVARGPSAGAELAGLVQDGRTAWRYSAGADTVEYLRTVAEAVTLQAELRRNGRVVGRSRMTAKPDGTPLTARLLVPSVPAKLEITFYETTHRDSFPPETWRPAEP